MENKKTFSKLRLFLIFLALAVCYAAPNYAQYQLSGVGNEVQSLFNTTLSQYNFLFTAPMIPAVFLGVVSGMLVDKFGHKLVLAISVILTVIGGWLRLFAVNYAMMFISMLLIGFSAGFITSNMSKVVTHFFSIEKVGLISGFIITVSTCLMMLSMSTTALMGMKTAFLVSAIVASVGLVLWLIFIPSSKPTEEASAPVESVPMKESLLATLKNKHVWAAGIAMFCVGGAMTATGSSVPAALIEKGMAPATAGLVGSMMMVGNLIASLLTPTIIMKTGKYRLLLIICGIISVIGTAFAWTLTGPLLYIGMILIGFAFGTGMTQLMSCAVRLPGIGPKYAGSAGGVIATLDLLGSIIIPSAFAAPIAGSNYSLYFILAAATSFIWIVACYLMPRSLDTKG